MRRQQFGNVPLSESIGHIPRVLFHQLYEPDGGEREKIEACGEREERFIRAEQCLIQELEQGLHLTGVGAEYRAVREAALYRRGRRGSLQCGQEPDIYHIVYDTSISGRDRCARAQSVDKHIHPHPLVSVVIPSKDHPEVLEQCLSSFRKDNSIFIAEDVFLQAELNHIFSSSMKSFAYYGITVVTEKDWIKIKNAAQAYPLQMTASIICSIDNWANECFKEESCFTICGI